MHAHRQEAAPARIPDATRLLLLRWIGRIVDKRAPATPSLVIAHRRGGRKHERLAKRHAGGLQRKGFAGRSGYGKIPVCSWSTFINGFTDPSTPLGGDFAWEINATRQLQEAFRRGKLPIIYTTIAYAPDLHDGGIFVKKVPSLAILQYGSPMSRSIRESRPAPGESVIEKKYASSFFGTDLDLHLRLLGIDTVIMAGCTTSGCIRASAIDSLQYGYHTIVVREAVGDRAAGPHEANLFDIDAKYADVVPLAEALEYLGALHRERGFRGQGAGRFRSLVAPRAGAWAEYRRMAETRRPAHSSVFDDMLAKTKKQFDDLYRGSRRAGERAASIEPPTATNRDSGARTAKPSGRLDASSSPAVRLAERAFRQQLALRDHASSGARPMRRSCCAGSPSARTTRCGRNSAAPSSLRAR